MAEITPMMKQYLEIKEQNKDSILFFRLGDFYEMFNEDAQLASRELDLTLTTRDRGKAAEDQTPMCGIPYHSSDAYIARLIAKGYKVAICEQTEDPALAKGLVKRDIIRVITPGTVIDSACLDDRRGNFLCGIFLDGQNAGAAFCDMTTGHTHVTAFSGDDRAEHLYNELSRFSPAEAVLSAGAYDNGELVEYLRDKLSCAVERGEQGIYIPSGSFRLEAGDRISFVASIRDAQAFFHQIKLAVSRVRTVMIVGGGHIAYYLAKQLTDLGMGVKIIEVNYERCLQLSTLLPKAEILHGDGTNEGFLRECGIAQTDAFAALTGIDEENVLMGLYVRKTFPKVKVITKINRYSFQSIIETMDLGSVFNPRFSTSNVICRYARSMQNSLGSNVETLYKLVGGKAEALEFRVAEGSAVCGIPLQTLRLRKNLLIGCINRAGKILIPSGQDTIEPGDTVVVVTSVTGLNELDDILDKRRG